ncbi:hypothetical protein BGZ63DRAFT_452205 [Mariannaea sp. PMI_226]|nr:hypothetical protein BGZ63DRAFT_452205 [Mariannaea sp. PMI_226]
MLSSEIPTSQCGLLRAKKVDQILTAKLFMFIIGRNKTEFYLHPGLVSCLSAQLRSLIDEVLAKKSGEDYIHLEDVGDDVFSRFAQFAYAGSYAGFEPAEKDLRETTAKASIGNVVENQSARAESANDLGFLSTNVYNETYSLFGQRLDIGCSIGEQPDSPQSANALGLRSNTKDAGASSLFGQPMNTDAGTSFLFRQPTNIEKQCSLPFSLASCRTATKWGDANESCHSCNKGKSGVQVPSKRKHRAATCECDLQKPNRKQEFVSGFMQTYAPSIGFWQNAGQSKIWAFARRYAIASLMDLSYENLVQDLVYWVMSAQTFMPIYGELIRFVYGSCKTEGDKLRLLMAHFAACVAEDVSHLEGWPELLNTVPAFAIDLVRELTYRCA